MYSQKQRKANCSDTSVIFRKKMSKKPNATGHGGHSRGGRDRVDTVKILGCIYISLHIMFHKLVVDIYNILNIIAWARRSCALRALGLLLALADPF